MSNIETYIDHKSGDVSDGRLNSIESALSKLGEFSSDKGKDPSEVNINNYKEWLLDNYTSSTARSYVNDARSFLKFTNSPQHLEDNLVKGDESVSEDAVVCIMKEYLSNIYSESSIKDEHTIAGARIEGYNSVIPDIVVHDSNTVVECKSSTINEITRGIGQAVIHKSYGYTVIIATPLYWDNLIEVCQTQGIGLVYVDVDNREVNGLVEPS